MGYPLILHDSINNPVWRLYISLGTIQNYTEKHQLFYFLFLNLVKMTEISAKGRSTFNLRIHTILLDVYGSIKAHTIVGV